MTAGLLDPLDRLLDRARGSRALVSVTTRVEIDDPSAAVFASRMADDRWFLLFAAKAPKSAAATGPTLISSTLQLEQATAPWIS